MAKPILIVKVGMEYNKSKITEHRKVLTESLNDEYHVIFSLTNKITDGSAELEVLNADILTPIDIEMLRMKLEQIEL